MKLGDRLLELEEVIDKMIDENDLQWGDVLNLVHGHLQVHRPDAQEDYVAGGSPVFFYGPKEHLTKSSKRARVRLGGLK